MISDPVANRTRPEVRALYQVLGDADVAFGNCEEAVASRGTLRGGLPQTAPLEMFDDFRTSGFDMLSMANNHGLDYGPDALAESLAVRAAQPDGLLIGIGEDDTDAYRPFRATVHGQRIAVIAATQVIETDQGWPFRTGRRNVPVVETP